MFEFMKNTNLIGFIAYILIIFYSCENYNSNNSKNLQDSLNSKALADSLTKDSIDKLEKTAQSENNSNGNIYQYADSTVIKTNNYYIRSIPYSTGLEDEGEEGGIEVTVTNIKTGKSYITSGPVEFAEGEYMFTGDDGSGTTSEVVLGIQNLSDGKIVFSTAYIGDYRFEKGIAYFTAVLNSDQLPEANKLPKCAAELQKNPQNIGYTEEQQFNFSTGKLIRTGKFSCCFVE